jgi:hypothetical protein
VANPFQTLQPRAPYSIGFGGSKGCSRRKS